ncbi:MAG: HPr kinase/phosphatase C-terminal domain-containing protein [Pseudomonadota bacterium]
MGAGPHDPGHSELILSGGDAGEPGAAHASAVAFGSRGVLVFGPSGSGKSSLCLSLMALGADLISDDRVLVSKRDAALWLSPPAAMQGKVEARGVGILSAAHVCEVPLVLAVDMGKTEKDRLPQRRHVTIGGTSIPLLRKTGAPDLPAVLKIWLTGEGRWNDG